MNTNIIVLIASIIVGIVYDVYIFSQPMADDPGFGAIAQGLGIIMGVFLISIVFGIGGFFLTRLETSLGERFMRAISWCGVSLGVILALTIIGNLITKSSREAEWEKLHPEINYEQDLRDQQK